MKSKLKVLLDKSEADDALIDQLKSRSQSFMKPPVNPVEKRQSIFTEQDNSNLNDLKRINSQQVLLCELINLLNFSLNRWRIKRELLLHYEMN